jgi:transposase
MFVRAKKNHSGSVSVQVIDKSSGSYKVIRTIGSSSDKDQIKVLKSLARDFIMNFEGQQTFSFGVPTDSAFFEAVYHSIRDVQLLGPELVLGKIFDQIGFGAIPEDLFRHLVISRLIYPVSKLKTINYLHKYKGISLHVNEIYRFMDRFHKNYMELAKKISYSHTVSVLGDNFGMVFYDVTTLYFEAADDDDYRISGFSKDGKHSNPQIVLGLLVAQNGYPLDYEAFQGNSFEGHTMLPVIERFKAKYKLENLTVVADAGLMSNKNVVLLSQNGYEFILGGRIKNENDETKKRILGMELADKDFSEIKRADGNRLIVQYSASRAAKDAKNREKGMERLKKKLASGKLSKKHINNKGYNKYLKLEGELIISIDEEKYEADGLWDGLKGYVTNTGVPAEQVMENYRQLWQIERTFRITKTDLKIRPVFHFKKRRIEAHLTISFVACKLYKEFERQLKEKKTGLSAEKGLEVLKTIFGITLRLPSGEEKLMILDKTFDQKSILEHFK